MSLINIMKTIEKNHKKEDWDRISKEQNEYFYQNFSRIKELYLEELSSKTLIDSLDQYKEITPDNISKYLFFSEPLKNNYPYLFQSLCMISEKMGNENEVFNSNLDKKDSLEAKRKLVRKTRAQQNWIRRKSMKQRATIAMRNGK